MTLRETEALILEGVSRLLNAAADAFTPEGVFTFAACACVLRLIGA